MKKILLLILLIFLVTGCKSYSELNDLAIINAIGITKSDNNYKLYSSIVIETDEKTLEPKTEIIEIAGISLNEIFDKLSLSLNKKIYISHMDLLLIDETIKTNEFKEITNFFLNNNKSREDFLVATTDNIKEILKNSKFKEINDLVEITHEETSKSIYTTMYDVIDKLNNHESIYLSNISLKDKISVDGIKEFKNNNYNLIENEDTIFINYILNNINNYKYSYKCHDNEYLYLNILRSNTSNIKNELLITNEIKIITNDCNLKKDKIIEVFNNHLNNNLEKFTNKKITIKNTIRGTYENK